jgi:hypothetical protein
MLCGEHLEDSCHHGTLSHHVGQLGHHASPARALMHAALVIVYPVARSTFHVIAERLQKFFDAMLADKEKKHQQVMRCAVD